MSTRPSSSSAPIKVLTSAQYLTSLLKNTEQHPPEIDKGLLETLLTALEADPDKMLPEEMLTPKKAKEERRGIRREIFGKLKETEREDFFSRIARYGLTNRFLEAASAKTTFIPLKTKRQFEKWFRQPKNRDLVPRPPAENIAGFPVKRIDHALVKAGTKENAGNSGSRAEKKRESTGSSRGKRNESRTAWLAHTLKKAGINETRATINIGDMERGSYPWHIIDIQTEEAGRAQVVITDHAPNPTFVVKGNFIDPQTGHFSFTRLHEDKDNIWSIRFSGNRDLWTQELLEHIRTPHAGLHPQSPNFSWAGQESALEHSLSAYFVSHAGGIPQPRDDSVIEHGALAEADHPPKWKTAYAAVTKGLLKGWGKTTFRKIIDRLKSENPDLASFENAAPIQARTLYEDAAAEIRRTGEVHFGEPGRKNLRLANRTAGAIDLALEFDAVQGWEDIIGDRIHPGTMKDFLLATGLAKEEGDKLVPGSSPEPP